MIRSEQDGRVRRITLAAPLHRNVMNSESSRAFLSELADAELDEGTGAILLDAEVSESSQPINYNPCLECKLCVAACPVGAISSEGDFNFSACYTHNYREFMVDEKLIAELRKRMEGYTGPPVNKGGVLPWWPAKCDRWRSAVPRQPRKSRG